MKPNEVLKHYEMPYNSGIDNIIKRIAAQAIDMTNRAIVQECIKVASEAGITDLYLMDEKFLSEAIAEKLDRMKNEPLTLEELRKMEGEPVWVEYPEMGLHRWEVLMGESQFIVVENHKHVKVDAILFDDGRRFRQSYYGDNWRAYRYRVKEEHHAEV